MRIRVSYYLDRRSGVWHGNPYRTAADRDFVTDEDPANGGLHRSGHAIIDDEREAIHAVPPDVDGYTFKAVRFLIVGVRIS